MARLELSCFIALAVSCTGFSLTACSANVPTAVADAKGSRSTAREYFPVEEHLRANSEHLPIAAHNAVWGNPLAPITLVAFLDFQCHYCRQSQPELNDVRRRYGPQILRLVFKHFPLPSHEPGVDAALAAQAVYDAAGTQAFFGFEQALYSPEHDPTTFTLPMLATTAAKFGIPEPRFRELFASQQVRGEVWRDLELAQAIGVRAVPTVLVNGLPLIGAVPASDFDALIENELRAHDEAKARSHASNKFYDARVRSNWNLKGIGTILSRAVYALSPAAVAAAP